MFWNYLKMEKDNLNLLREGKITKQEFNKRLKEMNKNIKRKMQELRERHLNY